MELDTFFNGGFLLLIMNNKADNFFNGELFGRYIIDKCR